MIGEPFHKDGWGYVWSGVKATHGFKTGAVWYEIFTTSFHCSHIQNIIIIMTFPPSTELILTYFYFRYEVKVLDELETKLEPAVHELRLGWSTDDTDMQLGK